MITKEELEILRKPEVQAYIREKMGPLVHGDHVFLSGGHEDIFCEDCKNYGVFSANIYEGAILVPDCISRDSSRPERGLWGMIDWDIIASEMDEKGNMHLKNDLLWWITKDGDEICRELYDRHYSRRRYADGRSTPLFCGPGQKIVLRTWNGDALFAWRKFRDKSGQQGINCSVFRNESPHKSSELIRQADAIADFVWPSERHYTYVNACKIKSSNPGYCFIMAGWQKCGTTKGGLIVLERTPCALRDRASEWMERPNKEGMMRETKISVTTARTDGGNHEQRMD